METLPPVIVTLFHPCQAVLQTYTVQAPTLRVLEQTVRDLHERAARHLLN